MAVVFLAAIFLEPDIVPAAFFGVDFELIFEACVFDVPAFVELCIAVLVLLWVVAA
ncbi:MAG: hypothetical protein ACREM2_04140 [Vulcanimicrobiaceae bacterium]